MKDSTVMCNMFCVCIVSRRTCLLHALYIIVCFLIVYANDVENTLRDDESKTLIKSRKILEILIFILGDKQDRKVLIS